MDDEQDRVITLRMGLQMRRRLMRAAQLVGMSVQELCLEAVVAAMRQIESDKGVTEISRHELDPTQAEIRARAREMRKLRANDMKSGADFEREDRTSARLSTSSEDVATLVELQ